MTTPISDPKGKTPVYRLEEQSATLSKSRNTTANTSHFFAHYNPAVCLITTTEKGPETNLGTGFLIGYNLLMTCQHVIATVAAAKRSQAYFLFDGTGVGGQGRYGNPFHLEFNPEEDKGGFFYTPPPIKKNSMEELDFTIVALKKPQTPTTLKHYRDITTHAFSILSSPLSLDKKDHAANIVHHPCKKDDRTDQSALKKIHANKTIKKVTDLAVHYFAPTLDGSSGAPIFDNQGRLFAIHRAACPKHAESIEEGLPCRIAVRMSAILKSLPPAAIEKIKAGIITKKSLSDVLKEVYLKEDKITLLLGERQLLIKDVYTRVAIIEDSEREEKSKKVQESKPGQTGEKETEKSDEAEDYRIPTHETLFEAKKPIELEDLFNHESLKNVSQKKILILGAAGIGKSTLCHYIANRWADGKLWAQEFSTIFWVRLRNLNRDFYPPIKEEYTVYDILAKECRFSKNMGNEEFHTLLKNKAFRSQALLILDGYDELPPEANKGYLTSVLKELEESFPNVIITSRPQTVPIATSWPRLEVLGFDTKSIGLYADRFFNQNKNKGETFRAHLRRLPLVRSLAHIPINLEILCTLFQENPEFFDSTNSVTVSSLYEKMTSWLYGRFITKRKEVTQELTPAAYDQKILGDRALKEMAWRAMVNNTLYLREVEIKGILSEAKVSMQDIGKLGLFHVEHGMGHFVHLTFQEFFAGAYLASLYLEGEENKARKLIETYKFEPRFALVFSMTAGYLSLKGKEEQTFFNHLLGEPYDLAMSYELTLIARCFGECQDPTRIKQYEEFVNVVNSYIQKMPIKYCFNPLEDRIAELLSRNAKLFNHKKIIQSIKNRLNFLITSEDHSCEFGWFCILEKIARTSHELPSEIIEVIKKDFLNLGDIRGGRTIEHIAAIGLDFSIEDIQSLKMLLCSCSPEIYLSEKESAARSLGAIVNTNGFLSNEAMKALEKAIFSNLSSQLASTIGLKKIVVAGNSISRKAVLGLGEVASDPTHSPRTRVLLAASIIEKFAENGGTVPKRTLQALVKSVTDEELPRFARKDATLCLVKTTETDEALLKDAVFFLREILNDSSQTSEARGSAAYALGMLTRVGGKISIKDIETLIKLLDDSQESNYSRGSAAYAIGKIAKSGDRIPAKAVQTLRKLIYDVQVNREYRRNAAYAIGEIIQARGPLCKEAMQALERMLSDSKLDEDIRGSVASALTIVAKVGGVLSARAVEGLEEFTHDPQLNLYDRKTAAIALGELVKTRGALSMKALLVLENLLGNSELDPYIRRSIASIIKDIANKGESISIETMKTLEKLDYDNLNLNKKFQRILANSNMDLQTLERILCNPEECIYTKGDAAKALGSVVKAGDILSKKTLSVLEMLVCAPPTGSSDAQKAAATTLGRVVESKCALSEKSLQSLERLLYDTAGDVRKDVFLALRHISSEHFFKRVTDHKSCSRVIETCYWTNRAFSYLNGKMCIYDNQGCYPIDENFHLKKKDLKKIVKNSIGLDLMTWR